MAAYVPETSQPCSNSILVSLTAARRLPIWLWPQVITMFMVLGATLSKDWSTFTTFRSLQGLFGTVPQVIGLPIIHDMYTSAGMLSYVPLSNPC